MKSPNLSASMGRETREGKNPLASRSSPDFSVVVCRFARKLFPSGVLSETTRSLGAEEQHPRQSQTQHHNWEMPTEPPDEKNGHLGGTPHAGSLQKSNHSTQDSL